MSLNRNNRAELTEEEFVDAVARVIVLNRMIDEQVARGELHAMLAIKTTYVFGPNLVAAVMKPVMVICGDVAKLKEFEALCQQIDRHSAVAQSAAQNNARVAQAKRDYATLFGRDRNRPVPVEVLDDLYDDQAVTPVPPAEQQTEEAAEEQQHTPLGLGGGSCSIQ